MKPLIAAACIAAAPLPALSSDLSAAFQIELDAGRTGAAMRVAEDALAADPGNREARFALGAAQFLAAAEGLGQGLYRFGLRNEFQNDALGLAGMPFLRLPMPQNPEPEQVTYEGLRGILAGFVSDLAAAEATLAALPDGPVALEIDLGTARIDLDGNGQADRGEALAEIFDALNGGLRVDSSNLAFRFDESDVPWLRGYCHLLMAMAKIPLAHDWERTFENTFHGLFPNSDMPGSKMAAETERILDALMEFYDRPDGPPGYDPSKYDTYGAWRESEDYEDFRAFNRLENALWGASIADLVAFIHLFDWPATEPERMREARQHLLSMIDLSRESWRRILAETDDDREWVPGPHQTGRFTNLRVTDDVVDGWHVFLDEFEAVLNGDKLIRHWRFAGERGVNIRRMFDDPGRLDPVLIAAGPGVLPYLEDGESVSGDNLDTMLSLVGRGLFAYFVWFN